MYTQRLSTLLSLGAVIAFSLTACKDSTPTSNNASYPGAENSAPDSINPKKLKLDTEKLKHNALNTKLTPRKNKLKDFKKLNKALSKSKKIKVSPTQNTQKSARSPATVRETQGPSEVYPFTVGQSVDNAIYRGVYEAMNALTTKLDPSAKVSEPAAKKNAPPAAKPVSSKKPRGTVLTVWHTSNVHGEREDCGCPKRPLGGVARKATIIAQAKSTDPLHKPDGQLIVDAGNLLFKNARVGTLSAPAQEIAALEAEALVQSFNTIGCDAFLPGEYDLALGLETLKTLRKASTFPWVSANLTAAGSKTPVFKPFAMTKQAGLNVAIVGVTGPFPDAKGDFFSSKGAGILDPLESLKAVAPAIKKAKPDLVVLLSNLGVQKTKQLTESLRPTLSIDFVVASNTRRSTFKPVWDTSTPIVESGSRGKHLGRFDMHILNKSVKLQPDRDPRIDPIRDYINAYRSLHTSRKTIATSMHRNLNEDRLKRLQRNKRYTVTRLNRVESDLPKSIDTTPMKSASDASWFRSEIVPVDKHIKQQAKVRSILDAYVKRTEAIQAKHPELHSGHKTKHSGKGKDEKAPTKLLRDKEKLKPVRPKIDLKNIRNFKRPGK